LALPLAARRQRIITVELIAEVTSWRPQSHRIAMNKNVLLKIKYGEIDLGRKVRAAGAIWNRKKKLQELPYQQVLQLGLVDRMERAEPATEDV